MIEKLQPFHVNKILKAIHKGRSLPDTTSELLSQRASDYKTIAALLEEPPGSGLVVQAGYPAYQEPFSPELRDHAAILDFSGLPAEKKLELLPNQSSAQKPEISELTALVTHFSPKHSNPFIKDGISVSFTGVLNQKLFYVERTGIMLPTGHITPDSFSSVFDVISQVEQRINTLARIIRLGNINSIAKG